MTNDERFIELRDQLDEGSGLSNWDGKWLMTTVRDSFRKVQSTISELRSRTARINTRLRRAEATIAEIRALAAGCYAMVYRGARERCHHCIECKINDAIESYMACVEGDPA